MSAASASASASGANNPDASGDRTNSKLMTRAFLGWVTQHPETDEHGHTTGEIRAADYIYLNHGGPRDKIVIDSSMKVLDLKKEIAVHVLHRYGEVIKESCMILTFKGSEMDNGKTLLNLRIYEGAVIELEVSDDVLEVSDDAFDDEVLRIHEQSVVDDDDLWDEVHGLDWKPLARIYRRNGYSWCEFQDENGGFCWTGDQLLGTDPEEETFTVGSPVRDSGRWIIQTRAPDSTVHFSVAKVPAHLVSFVLDEDDYYLLLKDKMSEVQDSDSEVEESVPDVAVDEDARAEWLRFLANNNVAPPTVPPAQWFRDLIHFVEGPTVPPAPPQEKYSPIREDSCVVCSDPFSSAKWDAFAPPCGHPLCGNCLYQIQMDGGRTKCCICNSTYLQHSRHTNLIPYDFVDEEVLEWCKASVLDASDVSDVSTMTNEQFADYLRVRFGDWSVSAQPLKLPKPLKLIEVHIHCGTRTLVAPCTLDMNVVWLQLYVKSQTGLPIAYQRLTLAGKTLASGTIMDNGIQHQSTIYLTVHRLHRGGAKVIKHTVKAKALQRVAPQDAGFFAAAHNMCMQVMDAPNVSVNAAITALPLEQLRALATHLCEKHGKTTNSVKARSLHDHLQVYVQLQSVVEKCTLAMNRFKELVAADMEETYTTEEGNLNYDALKTFVTSTLAVAEVRAQQAAAMDM